MNLKFNINWEIKNRETEEKVKLVLFDCMVKMHELATINAPVDVGTLKASIKLFPSVPGFKSYVLADGVTYGIHMEFGTRPHYISAKHLKGWAKRVLGDEGAAYPVAKKIALLGVEAQPFMRPALDQVKNIWVERFWNREFNKGIKK
ncbi:MAG: hypothetical protein QQN41_00030 [Nitrosopumilus sp.]